MSGAVRIGRRPTATRVPAWIRSPEVAILGVLAAFSAGPLVALLRHASSAGLVFAGSDSPFPADQFQYESWIHQFGSGFLAANILDTAPSDHVFLHPMFLLSGLAERAGLAVDASYLLWKPAIVLVLFLAFRAYVWRLLTGTWRRLAALAIALFSVSPVGALVAWTAIGSPSARADLGAASLPAPATLLWGYLPAALSVALMPVFLLGLEQVLRRDSERTRARRRRLLLGVSVCGIAVSWLHPWQGQVLLLTVAGAIALGRDRRRDAALAAVPAAALVAPLAYYFVLSRTDDAWRFAQETNAGAGRFATWAIVVALLPLALPALAGVWRRWDDVQERMLALWPLAVLAVYLVFSPSFPQHAFEGVTLPLGILAVRGLERLERFGRPVAWGAALTALLVLPGVLRAAQVMRDTVRAGSQPFYLEPGEDRAIDYLADRGDPGPVLTRAYLGSLVPARTGRASWVGHPSWTRDFPQRAAAVDALFAGRLGPGPARALVMRSRAAYVLVDCGSGGTAPATLSPILVRAGRFGCAGIYRVRRRQ